MKEGNAAPGRLIINGTDVTVATGTSTQILTTKNPVDAYHGFTVQALSTNTATIFVGGSGVTVDTGIELTAGKSIFIPITQAQAIWAISGTSGQKLRYQGV